MDSDPTPGSPEDVRTLADELQTFADDVGEALGKIRGMAGDRAVRDWSGLSADAFRDEFDGVPENLTRLQTSYDLCARALRAYWPKLQTAQGRADRALERAIAAQADLTAARDDPGSAAARDLDDARRLAEDARLMREEAAREAARDIGEAAEAGVRSRTWSADGSAAGPAAPTPGTDASTAGRAMLDDGPAAVRSRLRTMIRDGGSDPIDLVTGHVFLPQTDLTLPGVLPLAFTRRLDSGHRAGRWFGLTWSSTVDERLEVDRKGVVLVAADGMLLDYPHPAGPGAPVMPLTGPRRPLSRLADGGYALYDPATGHTRRFATPGRDRIARLTRVTDLNGNTIDFHHDPHGTPVAIEHSGGYRLRLTTESGRVTALQVADPADGTLTTVRTFHYTRGHLTRVTDATGHATGFTYDRRGRVTSWTDSNGRAYHYAYDDRDRCVEAHGDAGHIALTLAYDGTHPDWPGHRVTTLTTAQGAVTRCVVNDLGQVVAEIDPLGTVTRAAYDRHHGVTAWTDGLGRTTRIVRDASGRPVEVVRPDGASARAVHDPATRTAALALPGGAGWRRAHDERGNCTAVTDPAGATTRYTYDDRGALASVTDPSGATTRIVSDAAGRPVRVTDPLGHTVVHAYDAFGRLVATTDALGGTTRTAWTAEGRVARRTGPDGAEERWEYDGEGNCVRHTDARGRTTSYEYSHFDTLVARTGPDGVRYAFAYDAALRLVRVTNPRGQSWKYEYDAAGRPVAETDFDGHRVTYRHDAAGRLVHRANQAGQTVTWTYDDLGRLTAKTVDHLRHTFEHAPDGGLARATAPGCEITWRRDAAGRITAETVDGRTLAFTHDAAGRRTSRTTPSGVRTVYGYDAAGRPAYVETGGHRVTFARDGAGRESVRQVDGGLTLTRDHDPAGRLTGLAVTPGAAGPARRRAWSYGPGGALVGVHDDERGTSRFTLDAAGRVTDVCTRDWAESYAYDAAGNQTHASWSGDPAHAEPQGDRVYSGTRVSRAGAVHYTYDRAGRVTTRRRTRLSRAPEVWRYAWDAEDRLVALTTPDGTVWRYVYDPFGRRVAKLRMAPDGRSVAEETTFTWDDATLVEQTTTGADAASVTTLTWEHDGPAPVTQTERLGDRRTGTETGRRCLAVVTDPIGTPVELVAPDGRVTWRARSTVWGYAAWRGGGPAGTPLRFPGQYHDAESGLHYNYHRYYDPETARYLSQDPLGLDPAPNPRAYVANPLEQSDPLGLSACSIVPTGTPAWLDARPGPDLSDDPALAATGYGRGAHACVTPAPPDVAESLHALEAPTDTPRHDPAFT